MGELTELLQQALTDAGFDPGPVDGIPGPKTLRGATAAFKAAKEPGPPGEDGKDGRTPTRVQLAQTADVIAYETEDEQK